MANETPFVSDLDKQIAEYEGQLKQIQDGLQKLDEMYVTQKEQGKATLHQLAGAIVALKTYKESQQPKPVPAEPQATESVSVQTVEDLLKSTS